MEILKLILILFKGSGEVYYKNIESARKAIKEYNGK
jgi:hypothetical protein